MIRVSIGTTKDLRAIVVSNDNEDLAVDVVQHTFNINKRNSNVLEAVLTGLQQAVVALEKHRIPPDLNEYFIVEFKNQHVYKWLNNFKVPSEHAELMIKITGVLDTIPYRLKFIHSDNPKAVRYATNQEYEKRKETYSTSLASFMDIEDN